MAVRDCGQIRDAGEGRAARLPAGHIHFNQEDTPMGQAEIQFDALVVFHGGKGLFSLRRNRTRRIVDDIVQRLLLAWTVHILEPKLEPHRLGIGEDAPRNAALYLEPATLPTEARVDAMFPGPLLS